MKKILLSAFMLALLPFKTQALEISHPFYLSPMGKITSTTELSYEKEHIKDLVSPYAPYRAHAFKAGQNFAYGIAPTVAIDGSISNAWQRMKYDHTASTTGEDTNIDWSIGATYDLYKKNNIFLQFKLLYLQKETHHNGGAYKAFNGLLKAGYDLDFVLPYLLAQVELPVFQHKFADNNPKYETGLGFYKFFGKIIAADLGIHYSYDELWDSKKWYSTAGLYGYLTDHIAIGLTYAYTLSDKGKNKADGHGYTAGLQLKTVF